MKLIVNADDFGLDELTTRAIDEAMARGIITGTTLMVNMPYAREAVALSRSNGYFDRVGLHLNLTAGAPLTREIGASSEFCDENGMFHGRWRKERRLSFAAAERALLRGEVAAQIAAFLAYRPDVFHIDSHHHVHAEWAFIAAIGDILKEKNVQSIRISRNVRENAGPAYRMYKALINHKIRGLGAITADYFADAADVAPLKGYMNQTGTIEIMLHPRRDAADGPLLDRKAPIEQAVRAIDELGMMKTSYAALIRGE